MNPTSESCVKTVNTTLYTYMMYTRSSIEQSKNRLQCNMMLNCQSSRVLNLHSTCTAATWSIWERRHWWTFRGRSRNRGQRCERRDRSSSLRRSGASERRRSERESRENWTRAAAAGSSPSPRTPNLHRRRDRKHDQVWRHDWLFVFVYPWQRSLWQPSDRVRFGRSEKERIDPALSWPEEHFENTPNLNKKHSKSDIRRKEVIELDYFRSL